MVNFQTINDVQQWRCFRQVAAQSKTHSIPNRTILPQFKSYMLAIIAHRAAFDNLYPTREKGRCRIAAPKRCQLLIHGERVATELTQRYFCLDIQPGTQVNARQLLSG